jgi:dATP/dGTP diphosphohydrolase, N-terminal
VSTKPSNPKDLIGSDKLPVHLWPASATAFGCIALANGAFKYGRLNWRECGVRASIYVDQCKRHLDDWQEGYESDPQDGVHNLCGAIAALAILIDSLCTGNLVDDRNYNGSGYRAARAMMEPHVKRLRAFQKQAGHDPKHWTIADGGPETKEPDPLLSALSTVIKESLK